MFLGKNFGPFSPAQKMEHFYWVTWVLLPSLRNPDWQVHGFILSEKKKIMKLNSTQWLLGKVYTPEN